MTLKNKPMYSAILTSLVLGTSLLFYACRKDILPASEKCSEFSKIEQKAINENVSTNAILLARKYDDSAHVLLNRLGSYSNISEINDLYASYVVNRFDLTLFNSKNRSRNNTDFIASTHKHVMGLGIETNSIFRNTDYKK